MFGPHVVALIDFLGQASALARWDFVPSGAAEVSQWSLAVRQSMGRVALWRDEFRQQFEQYHSTKRDHENLFISRVPAETGDRFNDFRQTALHHQYFSDTIIFYSPLQNEHGYWKVSNVAAFFVVCSLRFLTSLTEHTPLRGSIEVGMLSQFETGDPYGPGLAKAHQLESEVADYPRIVVGPTLLSYLDWLENNSGDDGATKANRIISSKCRDLITQDSDGRWILDYLNDTFANACDKAAEWRKTQAKAFAFVQAELDSFRDKGDKKLTERYERLAAYFVSRGSGR